MNVIQPDLSPKDKVQGVSGPEECGLIHVKRQLTPVFPVALQQPFGSLPTVKDLVRVSPQDPHIVWKHRFIDAGVRLFGVTFFIIPIQQLQGTKGILPQRFREFFTGDLMGRGLFPSAFQPDVKEEIEQNQ